MKLLIAFIAIQTISCNFGIFDTPEHPFGKILSMMRGGAFGAHSSIKSKQVRIQEKIMSRFNKMTQAAMTLQSAPIGFAEVFVIENKPTSPYDVCLDEVEVILKNVVKMARICLDKHWQDTIPIFVDTLKLAQKAVQCFQHPSEESLESKPDIKCIIDHLCERPCRP